jgi:hypothetical protein
VRFAHKLLVPALAGFLGFLGLAGTTPAFGASAAPATTTPATTTPATTTPLANLTAFHQMVVDTTAKYIFFSEGIGSEQVRMGADASSGIVVTDLAGDYVTTLDGGSNGDGVEGIAISPDGTTLYAALAAKGTVAAINVTGTSGISGGSPTQVTYSMPGGYVPYGVAVQSGKLWVSADAGTGYALGDFALTAASPGFSRILPVGGETAPDLTADPGDQGLVVAAVPGPTLTPAVTVDAATGKILLNAPFLGPTTLPCAPAEQLAVIPGTQAFLAACGAADASSAQDVYQYGATNLTTPQQFFPALARVPDAVAVSDNGDIIVSDGVSAYVYEPDATLVNVLPVGTQAPIGAGLAVSGDGSRLYAVTAVLDSAGTGVSYDLSVFDDPEVTRATLALAGPSPVTAPHGVSIAGKLSFAYGSPATGTSIQVTRAAAGQAAVMLPDTTTTAGGAFTITDNPPAGTYTYTASYPGTATSSPATATFRVTVTKVTAALTLGAGGTTAVYGATIKVTAHLAAPDTNRRISLYYQLRGTTARKPLAAGAVDSSGNLTATFRNATRNVVFTAVFTGDGDYTARTLTASVGVRVQRVSMTNSGYYGSNSYHGTTYRLYHHTSYLGFAVTVAPNKHGQCVRLLVQQLSSQGTWFTNGKLGCYALSSASNYANRLSLSSATGARYRVEPFYIPSKADPTNIATYGSWFYFQVVT